ncbi:MAG TPA: DNA polymerase ligase N-terminal domain-containing protein [Bryobacteraceae bacterium]|nr:DNA polymerase ligase N-terminal domain-containing protein [Bryobacteraceae bacterium]
MTGHKFLSKYKEMRDFSATPEPSGGNPKAGRGRVKKTVFVVQKHDASHLHYDFRIEVDGVLKSWAVPKGPSADPSDKRLAMPTEDHPLEYTEFEGKIPEGNYGAGAMIIWDTGTYRNLKDISMSEALDSGHLAIWLDGKKLKGGYSLRRVEIRDRVKWLLVKMKDAEAGQRDLIVDQPNSVISGLSVEEMDQRG